MLRLRGLLICVVTVAVLVRPFPLAFGADTIVTLRKGTAVFLIVDHPIDSQNTYPGASITLRVLEPVVAGQAVVVPAGEIVRGEVTEAKKAKSWGRPGHIGVRIESTTAVDGQKIGLRASEARGGKGHTGGAVGVSLVGGLLCLPLAGTGFLMKGEAGLIPTGYEFKALVTKNHRIMIAAGEELSIAEERRRAAQLLKEIKERAERERKEKEALTAEEPTGGAVPTAPAE